MEQVVQQPHRKKRKYQFKAFLWLLIPMAFLLIFSYYPPIKAVFDSFFDSKMIGGVRQDVFVGFDNYKEIFSDQTFWICVKNVLIFTAVGMVCGNFMTIFLAELLFNMKTKRHSAFFRVLFIIPILVPSLVILLIWKNLIFSSNGLLYQLGINFGVKNPQWYWDERDFIAKFAIIFTNFPWVAGTSFLIYLAGLQNISKSVMEASKLDNCSVGKRIRKIDLPLLWPQLKYFLIMGVIGGFQNFDLQLIIVGQEYNSSNVLGLYLYDRAFGVNYTTEAGIISSRFGYASAVGIIILIVTMTITIMNMRLNGDKTKKAKIEKTKSFKQFKKELKKNEAAC